MEVVVSEESKERREGGSSDARAWAIVGMFVLLFFYTLYFAKAFFLPVVIAILLRFLLAPAVRLLGRLRIPAGISAALLIAALLFAGGYGLYRLSDPAARWLDRAPHAIQHVEYRLRGLEGPVEDMQATAERVEREVGQMASAVVTIVLLFFLLASGEMFLRRLVKVLPRLKDKKEAIEIAHETERRASTYLATFTLINAGLAIAVAFAMHLAGLPNPELWGVVAGVLNFVPYLGPIVTTGVIGLVSVLTFEGLGRALAAPAIYVVINFVESSFVTPSVLGQRLALNPVVIFVALIFWGWLWGIPGALLAVPILATFKIFCEHIEPLSPVGEFLGR